jgi:tRNA dimethylallyltransferase
VISLLGPTGSGKTALALTLARHWPVTVVNLDSRQVYRDFPIITAQPGEGERAACPHRLYGFLDTAEPMAAGRFGDLAREEVAEALAQGRLPVLVGGTGLYLRGLTRGFAPIPPVPPEVRAAVQERYTRLGPESMHLELSAKDPAYARRIHPNNRQHVCRALEVHEATGLPFSYWHAQDHDKPQWRFLKIGVGAERYVLNERLVRRTEAMLAAGAVDEARVALEHCPDVTAPGWTGIGCSELAAHLRGEMGLDEAVDLWVKNTKAYAKRQMTWFKPEPELNWVESGDEEAALTLVRESLETGGSKADRTENEEKEEI